MPKTMNVEEWARAKADDKPILDRIWHSSFFSGARSFYRTPGARKSKALKVAGYATRTAAKFIPIPIVGTLVSIAQNAAESRVRNHLHEKRRKKNVSGPMHTQMDVDSAARANADLAKWSVKCLDISSLDDKRKKIEYAMEDLRRATNQTYADDAPCMAHTQSWLAVAQLERRCESLTLDLDALAATVTTLAQYVTDSNKKALDWRRENAKIWEEYSTNIAERMAQYPGGAMGQFVKQTLADEHKNCKGYCEAKNLSELPGGAAFRQAAATFVKTCANNMAADIFVDPQAGAANTENIGNNYKV